MGQMQALQLLFKFPVTNAINELFLLLCFFYFAEDIAYFQGISIFLI